MSLLFYHGHDCDKSVVTVIFLVCDSDFCMYDCHFFDFDSHLLYFDSDFSHFGRDVSTYDSHFNFRDCDTHIYDCDARVLRKSDILLYNPKFLKLANRSAKNMPKLANNY